MKILKVEPFSGISGDMFLGALVDLGASAVTLLSLPGTLGLEGASVRIDQETYKRLKAYLVDLAPRRSVEPTVEEFRMLDFEPYAPIRRQLLNLVRAVNRARGQAGFDPVPVECLRLKRRIYQIVNNIQTVIQDFPVCN